MLLRPLMSLLMVLVVLLVHTHLQSKPTRSATSTPAAAVGQSRAQLAEIESRVVLATTTTTATTAGVILCHGGSALLLGEQPTSP